MIVELAIGVCVVGALLVLPLLRKEPSLEDYYRRRREVYDMRYRGGDEPCDVCGRPSMYYLDDRPLHPECREDSRVVTL